MAIELRQIHPLFVGEVSGVDLRKPIDAATVAMIKTAIDKYAVLVVHDQHITDEQQIAFSKNLGPLETTIRAIRTDRKLHLDTYIADVSNLNEKAEVLAAHDPAA